MTTVLLLRAHVTVDLKSASQRLWPPHRHVLQKTRHIKLRAEATISKELCNRGLGVCALREQTLLIRTWHRYSSEFVFKTSSEPLASRPVAGGIARRRWRSLSGRRSIACRSKTVLDNNSTAMCGGAFAGMCNPTPTRPPAAMDVVETDAQLSLDFLLSSMSACCFGHFPALSEVSLSYVLFLPRERN